MQCEARHSPSRYRIPFAPAIVWFWQTVCSIVRGYFALSRRSKVLTTLIAIALISFVCYSFSARYPSINGPRAYSDAAMAPEWGQVKDSFQLGIEPYPNQREFVEGDCISFRIHFRRNGSRLSFYDEWLERQFIKTESS